MGAGDVRKVNGGYVLAKSYPDDGEPDWEKATAELLVKLALLEIERDDLKAEFESLKTKRPTKRSRHR